MAAVALYPAGACPAASAVDYMDFVVESFSSVCACLCARTAFQPAKIRKKNDIRKKKLYFFCLMFKV